MKDDLKINADKYQDMTLEALADVCNAFVSISTSISANAATPAASGATTTPPATDQPPPSNRCPSNEEIRARLAAADKVGPHCLIRNPYIDCHKCLQAGYVIEHNPESPGGDHLITTPANQAASSRVRTMLLLALTDSAAHRFDFNPKFAKQGFEMVAELRKAHAPTSGSAVMDKFCALHQCKMKSGDTIESYYK